jgi:hypothetical protein
MLSIDSPYNHIRTKESTSNYNPGMIANMNWPIPGDDTHFMFWKGKKVRIAEKNRVPDR